MFYYYVLHLLPSPFKPLKLFFIFQYASHIFFSFRLASLKNIHITWLTLFHYFSLFLVQAIFLKLRLYLWLSNFIRDGYGRRSYARGSLSGETSSWRTSVTSVQWTLRSSLQRRWKEKVGTAAFASHWSLYIIPNRLCFLPFQLVRLDIQPRHVLVPVLARTVTNTDQIDLVVVPDIAAADIAVVLEIIDNLILAREIIIHLGDRILVAEEEEVEVLAGAAEAGNVTSKFEWYVILDILNEFTMVWYWLVCFLADADATDLPLHLYRKRSAIREQCLLLNFPFALKIENWKNFSPKQAKWEMQKSFWIAILGVQKGNHQYLYCKPSSLCLS